MGMLRLLVGAVNCICVQRYALKMASGTPRTARKGPPSKLIRVAQGQLFSQPTKGTHVCAVVTRSCHSLSFLFILFEPL